MRKFVLVLFSILCANTAVLAQTDEDLIQFSGVILDSDSLQPVPFATIKIVNTTTGTTCDANGIFSFVAAKGDSVVFESVGYKDAFFVIPDTMQTQKYSLIQLLSSDTMLLRTHMVYPWPSKEQFKQEFLK